MIRLHHRLPLLATVLVLAGCAILEEIRLDQPKRAGRR